MTDKSVLISIQPQWCELIASGKKTLDIRKTRPQIDTPFKCFIYCSKTKIKGGTLHAYGKPNKRINAGHYGKVIGEFVCDNINPYMQDIFTGEWFPSVCEAACLTPDELDKYSGGKHLYGYRYHISELLIYDKPRELSEFGLTRPPMSWGYVQERGDDDA